MERLTIQAASGVLQVEESFSASARVYSYRRPAGPMHPHRASLQSGPAPTRMGKMTRAMHVLYLGFNSIIAQFVLYVVQHGQP